MDSSITAAGRALRVGDPLGALKRVALRNDPAALALRGIAMAQLGDLPRARELLRRAARGFGPRETVERARCLTAEAEVALAARDLARPARALADALRTFTAHGDRENQAHARLLQIRRLLLLGSVDEAEGACARLDLGDGPARLAAIAVWSPSRSRSAGGGPSPHAPRCRARGRRRLAPASPRFARRSSRPVGPWSCRPRASSSGRRRGP